VDNIRAGQPTITMKKFLIFLLIAAVYIVHQDNWNWNNASLLFGFLPVGLVYHIGYSLLATGMMVILVKEAWPEHLENTKPIDPPPDKKKGEDRQ
jgi:hypothetical protein